MAKAVRRCEQLSDGPASAEFTTACHLSLKPLPWRAACIVVGAAFATKPEVRFQDYLNCHLR